MASYRAAQCLDFLELTEHISSTVPCRAGREDSGAVVNPGSGWGTLNRPVSPGPQCPYLANGKVVMLTYLPDQALVRMTRDQLCNPLPLGTRCTPGAHSPQPVSTGCNKIPFYLTIKLNKITLSLSPLPGPRGSGGGASRRLDLFAHLSNL